MVLTCLRIRSGPCASWPSTTPMPTGPVCAAFSIAITASVWEADVPDAAYDAELQRTVQQVWTDVLLDRASHDDVAMAVRSRMTAHLQDVLEWLAETPGRDAETRAHRTLMRERIERFLNRAQESSVAAASSGDAARVAHRHRASVARPPAAAHRLARPLVASARLWLDALIHSDRRPGACSARRLLHSFR